MPERRAHARVHWSHPTEGQDENRMAREGGEDGSGSGEKEVLSGVHESLGQGRGVSSVEARGTGRSTGDRAQASTEACAGLNNAPLHISNLERRPGVLAARRNRPAVWGAPPEASC